MPYISSFSIRSLNDYFNYTNCKAEGVLADLLILYGDNGSGKTTVLTLIFHLLSSGSSKGHLTAIGVVPFKELRVALSDGTEVLAERPGDTRGFPIDFSILKEGKKKAQYSFIPEKMRERLFQEKFEREFIRTESRASKQIKDRAAKRITLTFPYEGILFKNSDEASHKKYLNELEALGLNCYLMPTDRRIRSDLIGEFKASPRMIGENERQEGDVIARVRSQYLKEALANASRHINRQVIKASSAGSKSTNDIFNELIRKIASDSGDSSLKDWSNYLLGAINSLDKIARDNKRLADLGIVPELSFDSVIPLMENVSAGKQGALATVLRPYIDSLTVRQIALNPIGNAIQTFLRILNNLLSHKSITFSPGQGFLIFGPKNESLEPDELSSGEQQLLLMFCYLLMSNEQQSIFMIDEPEISLNVKWQRELIDAMRSITKDADTQIVIATHSIELLAQYSEMVVSLEPSVNNDKKISHDSIEADD